MLINKEIAPAKIHSRLTHVKSIKLSLKIKIKIKT